jgi:hypothetical protein
MTTDELLEKLPKMIGNNRIYDNGQFTGWYSISSPYDSIEWLQLCNDGEHWIASYGNEGEYVCLNPRDENPPYNNAFYIGDTPNEALQGLYDWCVENGFIPIKLNEINKK